MRRQKAASEVSRSRNGGAVSTWAVLCGLVLVAACSALTLLGEQRLEYSLGQRVAQPVYARVDFQVPDPRQTRADREAARAATPSYYVPSAAALTVDKIRTDLTSVYEAASAATTFDAYATALAAQGFAAEEQAYHRLRQLVEQPNAAGRRKFDAMIAGLPLEKEYVARDLPSEPREPKSTADHIVLEIPTGDEGAVTSIEVPSNDLVRQENDRALRGSASAIAKHLHAYQLESTVEEIIYLAFKQQPTIKFNQERTLEEMRKAEEATPAAMRSYEKGKPFLTPGKVVGSDDYDLLEAHRASYMAYLDSNDSEALPLLKERFFTRVGLIVLTSVVVIGLLIYTGVHQPRIYEVRMRTVAFMLLIVGVLAASRLLEMNWPQRPELIFAPCLLAASVLAIVYPRRFALGAMCIVAVLVATAVRASLPFLLVLFTGVAVAAYQLGEIRSRTKLIASGAVTALAIMVASAAASMTEGQPWSALMDHTAWAGGCAMLAAFVVSGVLPFIERAFRVATSLTLLEWRDPTRPLLQLLAREAPGTYNHSLVLGTLAESACERIGANGLLAQVGALYHDIGKIHKADYFVENQAGGISRHDKLAPNMSLLIILGHVKDGMEMAKEYKLPRVLHQFIAEHHGTSVVRYFHHVASEQQPKIASGKHDREVPEAEFRYGGPKPRTRESAVVMLCDGVEGAVRSLNEATVGRIESVVHQIVNDRVNDGQLSDCDMTMREIRQVEDSMVKSLSSIYHGRVAYPKAPKPGEDPGLERKVSG